MFNTEHEWIRGGETQIGLFTPDEGSANLWNAAKNGDFSRVAAESGIFYDNAAIAFQNLVSHEYIESSLMEAIPDLMYQHPESWRMADGIWEYKPGPNAFGAHDLAPNSFNGSFRHWGRIIGQPYNGPTVTDLSNSDNINQVIQSILSQLP